MLFKQQGSNLTQFLPQSRVFSGDIHLYRVFLTLPLLCSVLSPAAPSCALPQLPSLPAATAG